MPKSDDYNIRQNLCDKIESIKSVVSIKNGDRPELWIQRQNLQDLYHKLLLVDLDFCIDKKLEQDLWNLVFKSQINFFQSQIKEMQNANQKLEAHASLAVFLESARGFYIKLIEDLIIKYSLNEQENSILSNLPFCTKFRSFLELGRVQEQIAPQSTHEKQILYIFHHVLTHLGDISRYETYYNEAINYYMHACKLVPYLGQSYNQLGILYETMRTNSLSTVFYYIRSLETKYKFPLAQTNLENFYLKIIDIPLNRYSPSINQNDLLNSIKLLVGKLAQKDLITLFLQINAIFYSCLNYGSSDRTAKSSRLNSSTSNYNNNSGKLPFYVELFKVSLSAFMESMNTQKDKIDSLNFCQMIIIVIYSLNVNQDNRKEINAQLAFSMAIDLFAFLVELFITFYNNFKSSSSENQNTDLVLPCLYICFNFIEAFNDGYFLKENKLFYTLNKDGESSKINQFCSSCVNFLNNLDERLSKELLKEESFKIDSYDDYPLHEDRFLVCFMPLKTMQDRFSYRKYSSENFLSDFCENLLRKKRILNSFERIIQACENLPTEFYLQRSKCDAANQPKFKLSSSCPGQSLIQKEVKFDENSRREINLNARKKKTNVQAFNANTQSQSVQNVKNVPIPSPRLPLYPNQPSSFFPSASTRQLITSPSLNAASLAINNNGFPAFLPNANSTQIASQNDKIDDLIRNFELEQMQNQFNSGHGLAFGNVYESNSTAWPTNNNQNVQQQQQTDYLSNFLKRLALNSNSNSLSLNLNNDPDSSSSSTNSIWFYEEQNNNNQGHKKNK